jgi:hypothetical protein
MIERAIHLDGRQGIPRNGSEPGEAKDEHGQQEVELCLNAEPVQSQASARGGGVSGHH